MRVTIGTEYDDVITANLSDRVGLAVGMGGNDTISTQISSPMMCFMLHGGEGNDTYNIKQYSNVFIGDSGGTSTVKATFGDVKYAAFVENDFFHLRLGDGSLVFVRDYENVIYQLSSKSESFMDIVNRLGGISNIPTVSLASLSSAERENATNALNIFNYIDNVENLYKTFDAPAWFNYSTYMNGRSDQSLFWEGYFGNDGAYLHFDTIGMWEDASPMSLFDSSYYYKSKTAEFYNINFSSVTENQIQNVKTLIHTAGMNAWTHYTKYGTREGIDPSSAFDTSTYMQAKLAQMQKSDPSYTMDKLCTVFENENLNAAAHYEAYGKYEGLPIVGVQTTSVDMTYSIVGDVVS